MLYPAAIASLAALGILHAASFMAASDARDPAGLVEALPPEVAARRAFDLCMDHALGRIAIAPESAEQLKRRGFQVETGPINPAFGPSPTSARVMNTNAEIRAIGNGGIRNCNVTTSGAPTGPIEAAIKEVLAIPGTFGPGRPLATTNWTRWRWQAPDRDLQVGLVVTRRLTHSPHGLVLATVTALDEAGGVIGSR